MCIFSFDIFLFIIIFHCCRLLSLSIVPADFLKGLLVCNPSQVIIFFYIDMTPEEVQEYLDTVSSHLVQIPDNMRQFSLSMRSLFAEYAVGTSSDTAQRFRKLRDDVRNNAVVYVKGGLPVVKECVSGIKGFFEYYQDLAMDEWSEGIDDIIEETKANKEACSALIRIHEDITATLNEQHDAAKILVDELTQLSLKYEKEANEIEEHSNAMAFHLKESDGYILVDHAVSSPTEESMPTKPAKQEEAETGKAAEEELMQVETITKQRKAEIEKAAAEEKLKLVHAIAKKKEAEIEKDAAAVVGDKLIPALNKFITGIKEIAGIFEVMEEDLAPFVNKVNSSKEMEKQMQLHYNAMKGKAGQIMRGCNEFFAVLPSVRSDMGAIPTEGTDQNYVDRWMENEKKIIIEKCSHSGMLKKIMKAISGN